MILKWIQSLVRRESRVNGTEKTPLLDIMHEVFREEAKGFSKEVLPLARINQPLFQPRFRKQALKRRVRRFLWSDFSAESEEEITDEITEQILETLDADPHYRKLFGP